MTPSQARKLLVKIHAVATQGKAEEDLVMDALDDIYDRMGEHRCFCGCDWVRGGRRQGSRLCEQCFTDEFP